MKRRRRKSNGTLYITIIVALMLLAIIMGMSVFFKISDIDVTGVSMYTAEDVIAASGIEEGNSIFFINESAAAVKIKNALSYVDEVRIGRKLPNKVILEINESYPLASIASGGKYWIIDKNAKILEQTDSTGAESTIRIKGATLLQPKVGETVAFGESGTVQLTYLKEVLSEILAADIYTDVTWIDITSAANIKFDYLGRFTVNLGKGENIKDKLWMLTKMIADRSETDIGTIDLSTDNEGHYIPG